MSPQGLHILRALLLRFGVGAHPDRSPSSGFPVESATVTAILFGELAPGNKVPARSMLARSGARVASTVKEAAAQRRTDIRSLVKPRIPATEGPAIAIHATRCIRCGENLRL